MNDLTSESFSSAINDGIVLVDFYSEDCGPCKNLAKQLTDFDVPVYGVNVMEECDISFECEVTTVPTVLVFKDGVEVNRSIGFKPRGYFEGILNGLK